jgi:hypothetical protein
MTTRPEALAELDAMDVARTLDALEAAVAELTACVGVLTMSVRASMPRARRTPALPDWEWRIADAR